jgi:hypothetical protein
MVMLTMHCCFTLPRRGPWGRPRPLVVAVPEVGVPEGRGVVGGRWTERDQGG